ncbi:MAG: amidohydrolase [Betaproteobacteria bacterium]|nr:amidohydrolase [Betaproteobacteria bacterium]
MAQGHLAPTRADWLALTSEAALDPTLPICDAHHHLWDHGPKDVYLAPQLLADSGAGHRVVSTVFVDCFSMYRKDGPEEFKPVGETEWVEKLAGALPSGARTRVAAAIVGAANLMLGARVREVLEAHTAASARFRGIRHWLNWDPQTEAMGLRSDAPPRRAFDPAFREGYRELGRLNLSFDAWLYFPQLPDLTALARAIPEITVVLNHVGGLLGVGPYSKREEAYAIWHKNMTELATCPNVMVKLGGMGVPRCGFAWHQGDKPPTSEELASALSPYVLECIELFEPARCMFESNFPADKCAYGYTTVWNAFKRIAHCCSAEERAALFHDTAVRIYRLS